MKIKKRLLASVMALLMLTTFLLTLASCKSNSIVDVKKNEEYEGQSSSAKIFSSIIIAMLTGKNPSLPGISKPPSSLPNITPPETNPERIWLDSLEDENLGGYTVKFAVSESCGKYSQFSIVPDAMFGGEVCNAVLERNKKIEERFNCKIELTHYNEGGILEKSIVDTMLSGSGDYDVVVGNMMHDIEYMTNGFYVDVANDKTASKYINFKDNEYPYWAKDFIEGMSYRGKTYFLTGAIGLDFLMGQHAVMINYQMYNSLIKPTEGSIYDTVRNYKWTVDKMLQYADMATYKTIGITPETLLGSEAVVGIAIPIDSCINSLMLGAGVKYTTTEGSTPVNYFNKDNTALGTVYSKYFRALTQDKAFAFAGPTSRTNAFNVFEAENSFMTYGSLYDLVNVSGANYYVVPTPMLKESQKAYYTGVDANVNIYAINRYSKNIKASAIVLEAMCAESYRDVKYYLYGSSFGYTNLNDKNYMEMIDIICESAYTDLVLAWSHTKRFGDIGCIIADNIEKSENILSVLKGYNQFGNSTVEELCKILEGL